MSIDLHDEIEFAYFPYYGVGWTTGAESHVVMDTDWPHLRCGWIPRDISGALSDTPGESVCRKRWCRTQFDAWRHSKEFPESDDDRAWCLFSIERGLLAPTADLGAPIGPEPAVHDTDLHLGWL